MLSEQRVIHMTHMAIDEEKHSRDYMSVININKKDYLSWYGLVAFLVGTITYLAFFAAVVAVVLHFVLDNITSLFVLMLSLLGIIGYLMYLYIYMSSTRKWARKQYERGKRALKRRVADWERLEQIYREEEESKSPTVTIAPQEVLEKLKETEETVSEEEEELPVPEIVVVDPEPEEPAQESAIERLQRAKRERE